MLVVFGYIFRWGRVGLPQTYQEKPRNTDIRLAKTLWDRMQRQDAALNDYYTQMTNLLSTVPLQRKPDR